MCVCVCACVFVRACVSGAVGEGSKLERPSSLLEIMKGSDKGCYLRGSIFMTQ